MSTQSRRLLALALRFAVAALGLGLAFRIALESSSDQSLASALVGAWQVALPAALACFSAAWLLLGLGLLIGAVRFRGLLHGADLDIDLGVLLRAYLVATFFNLVLPGAMLGDVYRFWDARRDTGEGARVLGIVVVERLLSLAALGALALAVAPFLAGIGASARLVAAVVAGGAIFVVAALAVLLPFVNRLLVRGARLGMRFSPDLASAGERSLNAVAELARQPALIARAFAWSLVNQGLPVAAMVLLAVPLGSGVQWYWFAVIVPFVTLVSLLPISIGGTGVRELLYVSLFGAVGMRSEAALALSLSVLAAALLWGLVGLALFARGRRDEQAPAKSPAAAES